jgi:hypothetical protein
MVALAQAVDELTEAQNERNKAEGLAEAYCATYRSTRCLWHATAAQRDDLHRDMEVQAEIITKLRAPRPSSDDRGAGCSRSGLRGRTAGRC